MQFDRKMEISERQYDKMWCVWKPYLVEESATQWEIAAVFSKKRSAEKYVKENSDS